ncbi:hypothetical protein CL634_04030 [bacterium]|nr:hypothetical protein [bacterium]|tara:strand:- start:695 stop:1546 length:852 start_codon:yes stop_codon:yes gene_type:complete
MATERQRVANRRSKSRIRRLLSELRYYRELHKETQELFLEYDIELNSVLDDITSIVVPVSDTPAGSDETQIVLSDNEPPTTDPEFAHKNQANDDSVESSKEPKSAENLAPQWMKALFKKIAIETHPDKLQNREDLSDFEKREREILYKKASSAIETVNKMILLETAYVLEIFPSLSMKEQREIVDEALLLEKNKIASYHKLVSWLWGENAGNTELRCKLLIYVRSQIGLPQVDKDVILKYIEAFENDDDLAEFKNQYVKQKVNKKLYRKIGEHPAPSFTKSRK